MRNAERATGGRLLSATPGRSRASGGAGCASRPHRNHPVCLYDPQEHRARVRVDKRSQPAGGRQWQGCARTPACPKGHTGGEPNRLSPHLAFSTLGARENPAAESTTVKPVIQRIKASPNHTDLIRQITNWQGAVLADRPINAQHSCFSSFPTEPRQSEVTESVGPAPGPPPAQAPTSGSLSSVWPLDLHMWNPRNGPRVSAFARGLEAVFSPQRRCPAPDGDMKLCSSQGTATDLAGFERQTRTNPLMLPPGPAFHSPPAAASPAASRTAPTCLPGDRRPRPPASAPVPSV